MTDPQADWAARLPGRAVRPSPPAWAHQQPPADVRAPPAPVPVFRRHNGARIASPETSNVQNNKRRRPDDSQEACWHSQTLEREEGDLSDCHSGQLSHRSCSMQQHTSISRPGATY